MKIKYKNRRLYGNLFIGLVWIALGIYNILEIKNPLLLDYHYLFFGIVFSLIFMFEYTNQYLSIENNTIKKNYPFGKSIELRRIIEIKKYGGVYTLKTINKQFKINTTYINEDSLKSLNTVLSKLNLPENKTPFVAK